MKTRSLLVLIPTGVAVALLSCGAGNGLAVSATTIQVSGEQFAQSSEFQQVGWEKEKIEKLRHAYRLLEMADADYAGHRGEAMLSIRKAAGSLGVEIKGEAHGEEKQWNSDRKLTQARQLLQELIAEGGGKEQPHIHRAVDELGKALAIK